METLPQIQQQQEHLLPEDLQELLERFLHSQDIMQISRYTYERRLRPFFSWFIKEKKLNPTREDILQYKHHLEIEGLSPSTINNYIVAVRRFFSFIESVKVYPNIAKDIKGVKQQSGFRRDPLTVDQVVELLKSIETTTREGKRDFAIINLLVRTGLRTVELVRANIGDMSQNGLEGILKVQGKGRSSKDDVVVLTPNTLRPILDYLGTCRKRARDREPLFTSFSDRNLNSRLTTTSISRIVKEHLSTIGINSIRLTAHSLRHSAVTFCLLAGGTIQEAQVLARHKDINTTLIYSHNIDRLSNPPEKKVDQLLSEAFNK